jgi:hypothetical protein
VMELSLGERPTEPLLEVGLTGAKDERGGEPPTGVGIRQTRIL